MTTSPSSAKPFKKPPLSAPLASSSRAMVIGAAAMLLVAGIIWLIMRATRDSSPRLNDSTVVLAKFVSSSEFEKLAFDKQRLYYKVLDDRGNEIDQVFKQERLTEAEYRNAREAAWIGKHLNHVEKYFALPPGNARTTYVSQLVTKKVKKDAKTSSKGGDDSEEIRVDETAAELKIEAWPALARDQWKLFHDTYHREKKLHEDSAAQPVKTGG